MSPRSKSADRIVAAAALIVAGLLLPRPGAAGPIRTARAEAVRVARAEVRAYWDNYFTKALAEHRATIRAPKALLVLKADADGRLPQTPMVAYLQWRMSLRPANFARFHAQLSRLLVRDRIIRSLPEPPVNPTPGGVNPPTVPEPSTLLMAMGIAASAVLARRWSSRRALAA
jgi:hypothetical protein